MIKWLFNLFKRKKREDSTPKSRDTFMLPKGYYILKTKSHWDNGYFTTYIAYQIDENKVDQDHQIGTFKNWFPAASAIWSNYRLHKQFERDLKTDKQLREYLEHGKRH